jgi:hypothetical protein
MRAALKLNDMSVIISTFASCTDKQVKRQLAFMLARQGVVLDHEEGPAACPDDLEAIQVRYSAMKKLRIVILGFGTARHKMVLE